MPLFFYKVRDKDGEMFSSTIEAQDDMAAAVRLRSLGYSVISLQTKQRGLKEWWNDVYQILTQSHKTEIVFLTRQLAALIKAGIPIVSAVKSLEEQTKNRKLKKTLGKVARDLEGGDSFSESLRKHPDIFTDLFVSMVRVGETGGILDDVLERTADMYAREYEFKIRIRTAMTYPVFLALAAIGIVGFLLVNTVPKFTVIFEAYDTDLPLSTQFLLGASLFFRRFWFGAIAAVILAVLWIKRYIKTDHGRLRVDTWLLKVPLFGSLQLKGIVARVTRTLGVLLHTGVPITEALMTVEKVAGNQFIAKKMEGIRFAISEGAPLSEPLITSGIFPQAVTQMVVMGEKSGSLDQMLQEAATFYDREVEYALKNMATVLEPALLLVMGGIVAFIALSILMPIFNLIKLFH
ncbi:type II secretion system F family protein [PVC group bacterium]|nr:type II secretion system F family protein [PVC group bacterium]